MTKVLYKKYKKNIKRIPKLFFWVGGIIGDLLRKMNVIFPLYSVRYRNMTENYYAPTSIATHLFGFRDSSYENNVGETVDWLFNAGFEFTEFYKNLKK